MFVTVAVTEKIQKISVSMYKLLQMKAPQSGNAVNPPINFPSKYKPPKACPWKIALKCKVKQSRNGNLLTTRITQSIWKRKFPSVDKPPRK